MSNSLYVISLLAFTCILILVGGFYYFSNKFSFLESSFESIKSSLSNSQDENDSDSDENSEINFNNFINDNDSESSNEDITKEELFQHLTNHIHHNAFNPVDYSGIENLEEPEVEEQQVEEQQVEEQQVEEQQVECLDQNNNLEEQEKTSRKRYNKKK